MYFSNFFWTPFQKNRPETSTYGGNIFVIYWIKCSLRLVFFCQFNNFSGIWWKRNGGHNLIIMKKFCKGNPKRFFSLRSFRECLLSHLLDPQSVSRWSKTLMTLPQRSGLESRGHSVTVGKTILFRGKVSTTDFIGFSYQPAILLVSHYAKFA